MTSVASPMSFAISAALPAATIFWPRAAMASTSGRSGIQGHDAAAGDHEIRRFGAGAARGEADDGGEDWGDEVGCLHGTVL